jgi:hypothetical protein
MEEKTKLAWINIGGVKALHNKETDEIYVKKCVECSKLLTADEASYGHDCEV